MQFYYELYCRYDGSNSNYTAGYMALTLKETNPKLSGANINYSAGNGSARNFSAGNMTLKGTILLVKWL
jgi:hypothetical protein